MLLWISRGVLGLWGLRLGIGGRRRGRRLGRSRIASFESEESVALPLICSDLNSARFMGRMSVLASKSGEKGSFKAENLVKSFGWKVLKPMTSVILLSIL